MMNNQKLVTNEFGLQQKLRDENPDLFQRFRDSVVVLNNMLDLYRKTFPEFTDHSIIHAMNVLVYANQLIGPEIEKLSPEAIYCLLMGGFLHDMGMQITEENFQKYKEQVVPREYLDAHPDASMGDVIRSFHHEFSGVLIHQYAALFDFPTEGYCHVASQIARGHRRTDLYDDEHYPVSFPVTDDMDVPLRYLATLIRLADELDVSQTRSVGYQGIVYETELSRDLGRLNDLIRDVEITEDKITIHIMKEMQQEPRVLGYWKQALQELRTKLAYCREVINTTTDFQLTQKTVEEVYE